MTRSGDILSVARVTPSWHRAAGRKCSTPAPMAQRCGASEVSQEIAAESAWAGLCEVGHKGRVDHGGRRASVAQWEVLGGEHPPGRLQHGSGPIVWDHPQARRAACATRELGGGGDAGNVVLERRPCISVGVVPERLLCFVELGVAEENVVAH
eukprot:CAMPEP_0181454884 /NCGR_PEP_ID=MMETSP1110-20121109/30470_1 /TAXON_ID=174948 /ORGANISM="Symbiodinium sp., Strain CCMP421" /LENGTH=152 /DNA_ID=CAMNT_0023579247 /DNA_START=13 /DNA_END=472 /DNA_ORIENTATION=-